MKLSRRLAMLAAAPFVIASAPAAESDAATTPFTIRWTAPGDDGATGRATSYDLRYSTLPLNAGNFALATRITGTPVPGVSGAAESFSVTGLTDGQLYYMAIKTGDEAGNWSLISNVFTRTGASAGVDPATLTLGFSAPSPNPASQSVRWVFSAPQPMSLRVDVFDVTGRHVHTIASGDRPAGTGDLTWNLHDDRGRRVERGIYFVRARLGSTEWTKRLVVN